MTRVVAFLLLVSLLGSAFAAVPPLGKTPPLARSALISAKSGILMDRQTGLVLWQHNPDLPLAMASTTKIMTAMVILDHGSDKLNEKVRVSHYAASTGGSSLLAEGEVTTLGELLKGALICSSNEATVAAAEFLAGNEKTFVGWMNDKAGELGLKHTHFMNPHGLYKGAQGQYHYSTARDLALIARHALTYYPLIRQIVDQARPGQPEYIEVSPRGNVRLENHDKIVQQPVPGIPGAIVDGVKTGYVREAGRCLVSSATLNNWQLIAVVLNSEDTYKDNLALLYYGFKRFEWKTYAAAQHEAQRLPVTYGEPNSVPIGVTGELGAPVPRLEFGGAGVVDRLVFEGRTLRAPVRIGEEVGTLSLLRNGRQIAVLPAVTMRGATVAWWIRALIVLEYAALSLCGLIVLGIIYGTITKAARRRRRKLTKGRRSAHPGGTNHGER